MNHRGLSIVLLLLTLMSCTTLAGNPKSQWVYYNDQGKLEYKATDIGDRIPDFSNCGYGGGGVALPEVAVKATVEPGDGDDGARIQQAIDSVGAMPMDEDGFRGAVLLKAGTYEVAGTIYLRHSGVVLRGEGQDAETGTLLIATGDVKRTLIEVGGSGSRQDHDDQAVQVINVYVPVGAVSFNVDDASGFKVGQNIIVQRPSTAEWMAVIGMDSIPPRSDGNPISSWKPGDFDLYFDRVITAIDGNRITIDAPLGNSLDQRYGGGRVYPYDYPGRIDKVGVENLRAHSEFVGKPEDNDESHGWTVVRIDKTTNVWVQDVSSMYFGFGLADIRREAKWVTVAGCTCLDPVSKITGSRRYPFNLAGQLSLFYRCYARNGRHDFAVDSRLPGPSAFVDCWADQSHLDSGPHHRWAAGILFDNVRIPEHSIRIQDRLHMGSGHGWSAANNVMWNCVVDHYVMHNPPTSQNWAIGVIGEFHPPVFSDPEEFRKHTDKDYLAQNKPLNPAWRLTDQSTFGIIESPDQHVQPKSLYLEQLRCRLGEEAVENMQGLPQPYGR